MCYVFCQRIGFISSATAQQIVSTGLRATCRSNWVKKKKQRAEAERDCLDRYVTMVTQIPQLGQIIYKKQTNTTEHIPILLSYKS